MNLISAVRTLRQRLGESQQAFASRLGLSIRAIANYEKNRKPTGKALAALARVAQAAGEAELANQFLTALAEEMGPLGPAPPWIGTYPLYVAAREWAFMACVQRMLQDAQFSHLVKPYMELMQPVYAALAAEGKLKADEWHGLLAELEQVREKKRKAR